jgi:DNA-binding NtrC family response regulator
VGTYLLVAVAETSVSANEFSNLTAQELRRAQWTHVSALFSQRQAVRRTPFEIQTGKSQPKVMIVDDDNTIGALYELALNKAGIRVVYFATSGEKAIQAITRGGVEPDVIIMDHRMPGKDGISTSKEIMELKPRTKILMATAYEEVIPEALRIGINDFITKPFDVDILIKKILNLARKNRKIKDERKGKNSSRTRAMRRDFT